MKSILSILFTIAFVVSASSVAMADAGEGEKIFGKKCKSCHSTGTKKKMGPGLAGVGKKYSEGWLTKWIANPQKTWEENDAETQKLRASVKKGDRKKTKMKSKVKPDQVPHLVDYIKTL